jgi:hypothetical protein
LWWRLGSLENLYWNKTGLYSMVLYSTAWWHTEVIGEYSLNSINSAHNLPVTLLETEMITLWDHVRRPWDVSTKDGSSPWRSL